jgi:hypothetical protein
MSSILKSSAFSAVVHWLNSLTFRLVKTFTHGISVKDLKKKLNNILTKDESVVVSINGKWGVGKTYFWHQFKEQLTDKKVAYISLFGKETISSIRTDVFLQESIFLFNGMLINFHHLLSFDKDTHSLFCNWVKNTSKQFINMPLNKNIDFSPMVMRCY